MKTILLLAFAVLVSSTPVENRDKKLLGALIDELNQAVKDFPRDTTEIFLAQLEMNGCKGVFFCQAEQELKDKVSGRSGAKFEHFRTDKKLMRNLNEYNKCHMKTCEPADKDQEILLHEFLEKLLTCAQRAYSQPNIHFVQYFCEVTEQNFSVKWIPANLSETTVSAELDDKLNMTMKNVTKETKRKKILPKDAKCDITLLKELDELDTSMKNVSKETEILQKGAISNKTFPGELDDELDKAIKNVSKEAEEKKILLKDAISDKTPQEPRDKKLFGELIDELNREVKSFSNDITENEVFLTELPMNGCRGEFFCQAEHELKEKVSGRSGAKFDNFRTDKKLMRNLNRYNERHVKTCRPADKDQEILLHEFLEKLLTCVARAYPRAQEN